MSDNSNSSNSSPKGVLRKELIEGLYGLSGLQQGMLFHSLYSEGGSTYIEQLSCEMVVVSPDIFTMSWAQVINHHSALRSSFYYDVFSIPVQSVYREVSLPIEWLDYRHMGTVERTAAIVHYQSLDKTRGFDLKTAPLMRVGMIRIDEDRYRMIWTSHHLLFDGWSVPILLEEFLSTYESLLSGREPQARGEDLYEDYIRYIEGRDKQEQKLYWSDYLKGLGQGTLLPFIALTAERTKGDGDYGTQTLEIDRSTTLKIHSYSQANRITVNTLMQGVWSYLLHGYTGSKDISYGVTVSGRPDDLTDVERRVGMYINTLPLRSQMDYSQGVIDWLRTMQQQQISSREYQYTALHDIQSWTGVKGDLFDSILVFENYPVSKVISGKVWSLAIENVEIREQTNYPLTISIVSDELTSIRFSYNGKILDGASVKEISRHFEHVLLQIISNKEKLGDIQLLTLSEQQQILKTFNNTKTAYPKDKTITDLFEQQAAITPKAIALVYEDQQLTYGELNTKANQLAHYLRLRGVEPQTLVPICIERSMDMIIGILGILKSGGAYVPIDPEYPVERISYMLKDTKAKVVLSSKSSSNRLSIAKTGIIELDTDRGKIDKLPTENLQTTAGPSGLAYVIYTSGSTGQPKGVMVEHANVVSLVKEIDYIKLGKKDILLSTGSISFDAVTFEYWGMLLNGGQLVLCNENTLLNSQLLKEEIVSRGVSKMWFTSSWFNQLVESDILIFKSLRSVMVGGEKLSESHIIKVRKACPRLEIINGYGPTENTTFSLTFRINNTGITPPIPIGRPVSNRYAYILNDESGLVPIGIPGEIHIGGAGLARGYLNNANLTKEKFIRDPFSKEVTSRLYKTGDMGRWLPDGNIEFLGRGDDQVKIRGYRIELGEIESAIQQSKMVSHSVVLAKEDRQGNKRLVGYVVAKGKLDKEKLSSTLRQRLPEYMVPGIWVELESLPLTPNGKVDKRSLPDPDIDQQISRGYVAPGTATETKLADIWQELLSVGRIGIHDNFFELGGHSLLAMRLISSIRRQMELELGVRDLFRFPTIGELSAHLSSGDTTELLPAIVSQSRPERIPLSYSQERLWFIDRLEGSLQYHIPAVLRLKGKLSIKALSEGISLIMDRHEILRTVIREEAGQAYQYIKPKAEGGLQRVDGSRFKGSQKLLEQYIVEAINRPFDLSQDDMLRAELISLNTREHILVVTLHHIASDGWSTSVMVKELTEYYNACEEGRPAALEGLTIQYADYSIWQRKYLQGELLERKLSYWVVKLMGSTPLELPTDHPRGSVQSIRGGSMDFAIDNQLTESLQSLSQRYNTTMFMTLLAGFKVLLFRYTGQTDICVGTPIAGRQHHQTENLIGFFVNTLALRSTISGEAGFSEFLDQVRGTTIEAYEHQEVPFEKVVEAVVKERDLSRNPLFQVMFIMQNTPDVPEIQLKDLVLSGEHFEGNLTQFDLSFTATHSEEGLSVSVEYSSDLYKESTIERMLEHYGELLNSIVKEPDKEVSQLRMLTLSEEQQILKIFNNTKTTYPKDKTITELFEQQAARTPKAIALVYEDQQLTYGELNTKANQLAHYLQLRGVEPQTLVPICIERSMEMIIGMLGVLKSGGAYVPIDPEYPMERIMFMLEDTAARIVLVGKSMRGRVISENLEVIELTADWKNMRDMPTANIPFGVALKKLAYVIYTSGSTGQPKGVMIEHGSLLNYVIFFKKYFSISSKDYVVQQSSISFDTSVEEIYPSLISGATICIIKEGGKDINSLRIEIEENRATILSTTPLVVEALSKELSGMGKLRYLISGGDVLHNSSISNLINRVSVANGYGPSETTVAVIFKKVRRESDTIVIGTPIANTTVRILSSSQELMPIGIPGEIHIGGVQLARGYLNNAKLTKEKFIRDPFSKEGTSRLYKTGDMGRWLPDGNIEFLGRGDDQVKIRGYRIELGEIESAIQQSKMVSHSVVLAKEDRQGNKRLVGYVVAKGKLDKEKLSSTLRQQLPEYMLPGIWVEMESLPLTPNGKVDKRSLPDPDIDQQISRGYVAPGNATETKLAEIWQELLSVGRIGIHDNFFELGGHSLLAMRLISSIRRQMELELGVRDLFRFPTIGELSAHLSSGDTTELLPAIVSQPRPDRIPLSYSQERLWFIDRLEGSLQYHIPAVLRLKGKLSIKALSEGISLIMDRHEILRTVIREEAGQAYQYIKPKAEGGLQRVDGSRFKGSQKLLEQYIVEAINRPFDLSQDDMLRAELISLNTREHILVVTLHHIASDGWSTSVMVKELTEYYNAFEEGRPAALEGLTIQYADYSIWQRKYLQGELLERKLSYWVVKLMGSTPLELPTDHPRGSVQSIRGGSMDFAIDNQLTESLQSLSQRYNTTMFMTLLAGFKVLLFRYTGQTDICVGTPIAGRQHHQTENLIGFFVNTLALRSTISSEAGFSEFLDQVRGTTIEAYEHQEVPFEKVVEAVVKERDLSRNPLFQVMFIMQNTPDVKEPDLEELTLTNESVANDTSRFELSFSIAETNGGLHVMVSYCTDLYSGETIQRMTVHYTELLNSIVKEPDKEVSQLRMLTPAEQQQILKTFNNTKTRYPKDKTITELFEQQAAITPKAIALVYEDQQLTYGELNTKANQLAHYLRLRGVGSETLVPICIERGMEMIIGILGILKSGGAYVPIDPEYPVERINYMLKDTKAKVVLSSKSSSNRLSIAKTGIIELDTERGKIDKLPTENLQTIANPSGLAYVIYTSGSTGQPKGVMVEHGGVVNFIKAQSDYFKITVKDRILQYSNFCFDASVEQIFIALTSGASLVLFEQGLQYETESFENFISGQRITHLHATPGYIETLKLVDTKYLTRVIVGGEQCKRELANRFRGKVDFYNKYGPTETTVTVIEYKEQSKETENHGPYPIGKPIANTTVYILDKDHHPVPIGIPGEIHIGGVQLARGYLNNAKLTKEKFIRDPFSKEGTSRLYKTGDMGRWLPDGNIEFLGRGDDQVKIRGYRIELGEIESAIQQSKMVSHSVVLAKEDTQGNKRLVGYVVAKGKLDKEKLSSTLRQQLPEYMVPGIWVELESLPLTPNGKVDKRSLPDPDIDQQISRGYVAPGTATETKLADIWQELLSVGRIGIHDNFFELGGHSLLAMRLISSIRRQMELELGVRDLFRFPTIGELSAHLSSGDTTELLPAIVSQPRPDRIPLSYSQERLWFIDRLEGSLQYHIPAVLRLKGKLSIKALSEGISLIMDRHEILRTVIREEAGQAYQYIKPKAEGGLQRVDGSRFKGSQKLLEQYIVEAINRPFDLSQDDMLRAELISLNTREHILVVTLHHIASDGWSTSVMVKELTEYYNAFEEGRPAALEGLTIQYADYSIWQRKYLQGELLERKLSYWVVKLMGSTPLELPTDHPRGSVQSIRGGSMDFAIDNQLTESLQSLSQRYNTTMFMTLLAGFKVLLFRYTGQTDICVGTPIAGRQHHQTENLIGFFVNTLALRSTISGEAGFSEFLDQVRGTTIEAYEHQEVPFEKVVEAVVKERDLSRNPLFQVMFIMQNTPDVPEIQLKDLVLSGEHFEGNLTQFDLSFTATHSEEGLSVSVEYSSDLYKESTIERMLEHYGELLNSIVKEPDKEVSQLRMLTLSEEQQILKTFNNTKTTYPKDKTITELFEQQAARTPKAIALVYEDQQLTYGELNTKANQLAHYLQLRGVEPQTLVPICIERSMEMIIGMLGVLKSGGAYVPIDPEYPMERIMFMLEDTGARMIVGSKRVKEKLQGSDFDIIELDNEREQISSLLTRNLTTKVKTSNLAYVIYTSGSTGQPKGVMIEHISLLNYVLFFKDYFSIGPEDTVIQQYSIAFDTSVEEIFPSLTSGGCICIIKDGGKDIKSIKKYVEGGQATVLSTTPLIIDILNKELTGTGNLKYLISGGDILHPSAIDNFVNSVNVVNGYGPSEATVAITFNRIPSSLEAPIIGKPVSNTCVYIVDNNGSLLPIGIPGEILIGGVQLSRGYLNNSLLTAERFVSDPFSAASGGRLYKTGDIGRWLEDGRLEFLGRTDEQVKIRGYRIELGEIESVLQGSGMVNQSVVVATENQLGHKRLVGYVVAGRGFSKSKIAGYLSGKLPEYMVPSLWVELKSLPLTPNGKIDKKALPVVDLSEMLDSEYVAPRGDLERDLAEIWQELLGLDQVGIHDNFFELGGDSILTIQVVSRAGRMGYEFQARDLFMYQTISKLSAAILERSVPVLLSEQGILTGGSGLLPIQHWYLDQGDSDRSHYNQSVLLNIAKGVSESELRAIVSQIGAYHDSLRFRYTLKGGVWHQEYVMMDHSMAIEDIRTESGANMGMRITEISDVYQRSLDIGKGQLFRVVWIQTPDQEMENRLLLLAHHLAVDGVSWRIILEDIEIMLRGMTHDQELSLGNKTSSYRQWYEILEEYSGSDRLMSQLPYWQQVFDDNVPMRSDKEYRGELRYRDIGHYTAILDKPNTKSLLQDIGKAYHTEINDILLGALAWTISGWNKTQRIMIGMEGHGREYISPRADTSRTVGWFTSIYPVMLELESGSGIDTLIKTVKEQLRKIPDKGLGYGVLKYLTRQVELQVKDPWEMVFNYLGQLDSAVNKSSWMSGAKESAGSEIGEDHVVREKISINSYVESGELIINWSYSTRHYHQETIELLSVEYVRKLEKMIAHCLEQQRSGVEVHTPSDFGLGSKISYEELDRFLNEKISKGVLRKELIEGLYGLSGLQQGMLFHSLYSEGGSTYIEQLSCEMVVVSPDIFTMSWAQVINHHSALRSSFYYDVFSIPVQSVYREVSLPIEWLDYRHMGTVERTAAIVHYQSLDKTRGFDLKTAPLMRVGMIRIDEDRYRMIWTSHHLLFDGWSVPILLEEFLSTYESLLSGREPQARGEDLYEDYIRYIEGRDKQEQKLYWSDYLKGLGQGTLLPFIALTAERTKGDGDYGTQTLEIDRSTTLKIHSYSQANRITVNTLMQGVWSYLLHGYTGSKDISYGVTVSGRPDDLTDVERRVGMYINTLPLRSQMDYSQGVIDWLRTMQQQQISSREYQYTALHDIQSWTGVKGDLFDSILVFENYPVSKVISGKVWSLAIENVEIREQTNYPLTISIVSDELTSIRFSYNGKILDGASVKEISRHFEHVLLQIISNKEKLGDIQLLTLSEQQQILKTFNNTKTAYPKDKTITDLFEQQAAITPKAIALVYEDQQLTYGELNTKANQLAHYLRLRGVGPQTLVPICIERSMDMIIGILGILKSGGAYVPIDPEYPVERISYMLKDTKAKVVLSSKSSSNRLSIAKTGIIELDTERGKIDKLPTENLQTTAGPSGLAYVIYTSGSTGQPKGVMVEHGGVVNLIKAQSDYFKITVKDRILQFSNYSFDASVEQIFLALTNGASLIMFEQGLLFKPGAFEDFIIQQRITHLHATPNWIESLEPKGYKGLKRVIAGGDLCKRELAERWGDRVNFYNEYGPTETTVTVIEYKEQSKETENHGPYPIGKPIANTTVYILDKDNHPVPIGIPGEIHIGGVQLARGYLNNAKLTKEKFIGDPFSKDHTSRLYKTGDMGRWLPDGNIEFLGRGDDQVKIRGYRIELGEIESAIQQSKMVSHSVVLAKEDRQGNKRLVGYVVAKDKLDKEKLSSTLRQKLPEYMVPGIWVELESLPLTPNGKVDKKILSDEEILMRLNNECIAPVDETEKKLLQIWTELLNVKKISTTDNFFELGGHSILATRVLSLIRKEFSISLPIKVLFEYTSISELGRYIKLAKSNLGRENDLEVFDL